MLYKLFITAIVVSTVCMASCTFGGEFNHSLFLSNKTNDINCNVSKIDVRNISDRDKRLFNIKSDEQTYVHCKLKILNTSKSDIKYNLSHYYLSYNNKPSSSIYVDSVAHHIVLEGTLKPDETIIKSVYWVFDGAIYPDDVKNIKLIFQNN